MARMNIYVADDLKTEMDRAKDVVWSQVAADAFRVKLGELAAKRLEKTMQDVIQRLRASNLTDQSKVAAAGRQAGEAWARDNAEAVELKRLTNAMERARSDRHDLFLIPKGNAYCGAECFVFTIHPDSDGDRAATSEFWEGQGYAEYPEDEFVQAFAEAAEQVWERVKDRL